MENYTRRVFSMYPGGQREKVTIRLLDLRLDTVVDQFGTTGVKYEKVDEKAFHRSGGSGNQRHVLCLGLWLRAAGKDIGAAAGRGRNTEFYKQGFLNV